MFPPKKRIHKQELFVCTIEKAHSLFNSLVQEGRRQELGLMVVDEVGRTLYIAISSCSCSISYFYFSYFSSYSRSTCWENKAVVPTSKLCSLKLNIQI